MRTQALATLNLSVHALTGLLGLFPHRRRQQGLCLPGRFDE
jgi:hypothetical protein